MISFALSSPNSNLTLLHGSFVSSFTRPSTSRTTSKNTENSKLLNRWIDKCHEMLDWLSEGWPFVITTISLPVLMKHQNQAHKWPLTQPHCIKFEKRKVTCSSLAVWVNISNRILKFFSLRICRNYIVHYCTFWVKNQHFTWTMSISTIHYPYWAPTQHQLSAWNQLPIGRLESYSQRNL